MLSWLAENYLYLVVPVVGLAVLMVVAIGFFYLGKVVNHARLAFYISRKAALVEKAAVERERQAVAAIGNDTFRRQFEATDRELKNAMAAVATKDKLLRALDENLASRQEIIQRSTLELQAVHGSLTKANARNTELESALAKAMARGDQLQTDNDQLVTANNLLESQNQNKDKSITMLQGTVTDLNHHRDKSTQEIKSLNEKLALMEKISSRRTSGSPD